jgi:hypothetical protein
MKECKFKIGQRVKVISAITPSLHGQISREPQFMPKEGEYEYLISTDPHTTLGNLGDMSFFESELAKIEDTIT